jgi:hypothetical protein
VGFFNFLERSFQTIQHSREFLSHSPAHKLFVARLLGYFVPAMLIA